MLSLIFSEKQIKKVIIEKKILVREKKILGLYFANGQD